MITLFVGGIGSGKTLCAVREMNNTPYKKYYSNIKTINMRNCKKLSPEMIIKKEPTGLTRKGEQVYDYKLNIDFWISVEKPINIVIDEIHSILNSRRSMSKPSIIITDWLALLRKMLGATDSGYGELIVITQLVGRVDIILREMAHRIKYFTCHFKKSCHDCGLVWRENTDMPEQLYECPSCNSHHIKKYEHRIEVKHFRDVPSFDAWKEMGMKTYHRRYFINDAENYFKNYDTYQMDNLFSEF